MDEGAVAVAEADEPARLVYAAGEPAAGAFRCCSCGYGVSVRRVLPARCPMCGGERWEETARPFPGRVLSQPAG